MKTDHASETAVLADGILKDLEITGPLAETILDAIRSHRLKGPRSPIYMHRNYIKQDLQKVNNI